MASTHYFTAIFYKKVCPGICLRFKFLANPRSLLDTIQWLVGTQECLECYNILLTSYTKPLMWWWSYEWPQLITWQPFYEKNICPSRWSNFCLTLANPRSLLGVIYWLVGIVECLGCCNILLPSYTKPLMWWWSYEWPQLITWQPFYEKNMLCVQMIKFLPNPS